MRRAGHPLPLLSRLPLASTPTPQIKGTRELDGESAEGFKDLPGQQRKTEGRQEVHVLHPGQAPWALSV